MKFEQKWKQLIKVRSLFLKAPLILKDENAENQENEVDYKSCNAEDNLKGKLYKFYFKM